jgi:hypothetical protein
LAFAGPNRNFDDGLGLGEGPDPAVFVKTLIRGGRGLFDRLADWRAKRFLTERTRFRCGDCVPSKGGGGSSRTGHDGALPPESEAPDA